MFNWLRINLAFVSQFSAFDLDAWKIQGFFEDHADDWTFATKKQQSRNVYDLWRWWNLSSGEVNVGAMVSPDTHKKKYVQKRNLVYIKDEAE